LPHIPAAFEWPGVRLDRNWQRTDIHRQNQTGFFGQINAKRVQLVASTDARWLWWRTGVRPAAVSKLYQYTLSLVQDMMKKLGEVVGVGADKNKLLSLTPKSNSMTLIDATVWYRVEMNRLADMIDKTLPIEAQVRQAAQLGDELMSGATAGLFDQELTSTLREAFARPSIKQLTTELRATHSGSKLQEAILEKLTAPADRTRKWFEPGACFAAGTLVHTKEGLVPIEQIKVGDWVLSKPENRGEQAYKRVLKAIEN
jgi:hypothetical protein